MNHRESMAYLEQKGNEVQGIHLGLQRMAVMMTTLGEPQLNYPVVHVAGTNGKGSVAAMAESILRAAGLKTGLYTSPHLVRLSERIRVAGAEISRSGFARVATRIQLAEGHLGERGRLDRPLTYFEFLTACAFAYFADMRVEVGVIEVGLGGQLDATNVVKPSVCVLTGISLDHQQLLGNTIEKIAREKAGIIKPGAHVISGCRAPAARRVVLGRARASGTPLLELGKDLRVRNIRERGGRFTFDLATPSRVYSRLGPALRGEHQTGNAAMAVAAVEALHLIRHPVGPVRRGLAETAWPGRLEEYRMERLTLLDGAHNPEGASILRHYLRRFKPREFHLVFGAMRDKDIRSIGRLLFPMAKAIHVTGLKNPRSAQPAEIAAALPRFRKKLQTHPDSISALQAAWRQCPREGLVVVTGSLYLVGELLPILRKRQWAPSGGRRHW